MRNSQTPTLDLMIDTFDRHDPMQMSVLGMLIGNLFNNGTDDATVHFMLIAWPDALPDAQQVMCTCHDVEMVRRMLRQVIDRAEMVLDELAHPTMGSA